MLQVCPSISMFSVRVGLQRRDRLVQRPRRFRPQRVAVEVEVHVLERELAHRPARITWMLTCRARRLAVLRAGHRHRHRHRARPAAAPSTASAAPSRSLNVPVGALHAYVTAQPIESIAVAVTVDTCPTSTVHGLHCAVTVRLCCGAGGGGGGGGGGRRRRHIDAHARVIAEPELPARADPPSGPRSR